MLGPLRKELLKNKTLLLASTSPRRNELLKSIGFEFKCIGSSFEENLDKSSFSHPSEYVKENAKQKAIDVWSQLYIKTNNVSERDCIIIGADTIVTLNNEIIEKPKSEEDAFHILKKLSGREHIVYTGVSIIKTVAKDNGKDMDINTFHEATSVLMTNLTEDMIKAYIGTREPLDKAGAYGIQGKGSTIIEKINGDFYNVVGLPLNRLCKELDSFL